MILLRVLNCVSYYHWCPPFMTSDSETLCTESEEKYKFSNLFIDWVTPHFVGNLILITNQVRTQVKNEPFGSKRYPVWSVWNVSKYGVFSGPYLPAFGPEKNSTFGHFSCIGVHDDMIQKDGQLKKSMPAKFVLITLMNASSDQLI